jgi:hypothetical protein
MPERCFAGPVPRRKKSEAPESQGLAFFSAYAVAGANQPSQPAHFFIFASAPAGMGFVSQAVPYS